VQSKRYPDPHKQIDAGYFWLTIGFALSLLIVLTKPGGRVTFMFGFIGFGLFHLFFGKRNLRKSSQVEFDEDDQWWESNVNESNFGDFDDYYDENGIGPNGFNWLGLDSEGFDQSGFDTDGYDREGLDTRGMDRLGNIPDV
jgi:hypothetical protein